MLGDDLAAALPELRAHAESLLHDTGELQHVTGSTVRADGWREDTWTTYWTGPIRLARVNAQDGSADIAGDHRTVARYTCVIPISVTGVEVGHRVVVTSGDALATRPLYVVDMPPLATHGVLRRLAVSDAAHTPTR